MRRSPFPSVLIAKLFLILPCEHHRLPQASTCFNQLLLPEYSDVGILREKLELAINETEGFGLK